MNINQVTIAGHLTRDPEMRFTHKGTAVCRVGIAVNRTWKDESGQKKEEVTFLDADFWGKTAEAVGKYFTKGRAIYLQGRLKLDTWQDKDTKKDRSKLGIVADSFQFCDGNPSRERHPQEQERPSPAPPANAPGPDDDVPF